MEQDLRIYAKGLAFSDGVYDLRTLETVISNYRKILDRLISIQLGKRQVPKDLRSQLGYQVQINSGSIELLVKFLLEHKELLVVFAATDGYTLSEIIVRLLRDAIDLRKKASELIKKGITVNIRISNSFNVGSNINSRNVAFDQTAGSILINDPKILWAAQTTRTPINEILANVDGKAVEYIDMSSRENELRLTAEDREIIGQHKEELPTTLTIVGRLDMVAFTSHRGSIISDNERFSVTWEEHIRPKMQKIADVEGILFKVRPVIDHKRLDNEAIGFHVLDCGDPQEKMF
ncbi:hypothetical protein [Rhodoferax sp. BAB1]|uniref:hypothetical protein n=1 Tax=Rhodoferax sp. BAB1 TaxID=2741720 RepID=UPI00157749A6|nr:hypothetical protein [Rhodoferax sp. BAB1]QKO21927.1 hypothetical protein HTY51_08500 [Rhodoferax sp. BAB1]